MSTSIPHRPGTAATATTDALGARLDRLPVTSAHRAMVGVVGVGLFFDFFDSNLSATISRVLAGQFGLSTTGIALVLSSAFVGQFLGAALLGRLADRVGRRRAFQLNLALFSVATLAGAFAPTAAVLIVTRFVAGVGIGAEQTLVDGYLAEVLPRTARGRLIAWAYTIAFTGVPTVGLLALVLAPTQIAGIDGWRLLFVLGGLGAAVVWVLRRRLLESPRWLATQGRDDEAEGIVAGWEAVAVREGHRLTTPAPVEARVPGPRVSLWSAPYRRRSLVLAVFTILSASLYYGFGVLAPQLLAARGVDVVTGLAYVALTFLGYPLGSLLSVAVMERAERRVIIAASAVGACVCGSVFVGTGSTAVLVAAGLAYTLCSQVLANASHVYLAEQFPTAIRAGASGFLYGLSRLAAAALPFVALPLAASGGTGVLYVGLGVCTAVLAADVLLGGRRTTATSVDDHEHA